MSKATDGLFHDVVEVVVESLCEAGCIRKNDLLLAKASLGLDPLHQWEYTDSLENEYTWYWRRGSPMGTPLSFTVLSWVSAWAAGAFSSSRVRGDDAVGASTSEGVLRAQLREYEVALECVGAELNVAKTFVSRGNFTFCEGVGIPATKSGRYKRTRFFSVPACPAPGGTRPVVATPLVVRRHCLRQERVAVTLSPWLNRSALFHLPVELGGYGYTGRGLAVSQQVRKRLAYAVSRGFDPLLLPATKGEYRGEGLFPRRLEQSRLWTGLGRRVRDSFVESWPSYVQPGPGRVLLDGPKLVALMEERCSNRLSFMECETRVVDTSRRPARTRPNPFKNAGTAWNRCRPLSRTHGLKSLLRLARVLRERPRWVDSDFVTNIPVGTPMGRKLRRATVVAR
jgi:hypothetical protein